MKDILDTAGLVVGHSISHDINFLRSIDFSDYGIRDTQKCPFYQIYDGRYKEKLALKDLSRDIPTWEVQGAQHSSIEDSQSISNLGPTCLLPLQFIRHVFIRSDSYLNSDISKNAILC